VYGVRQRTSRTTQNPAISNMTEAQKANNVEQYLKDKTWVNNPEVLPWYVKDLVDLQPTTKELFETYSKVPSDEVVPHITEIRNKAFKIVCSNAKPSTTELM
jgi:hypothetical protein